MTILQNPPIEVFCYFCGVLRGQKTFDWQMYTAMNCDSVRFNLLASIVESSTLSTDPNMLWFLPRGKTS
jgi:hypothetical protein